MQSIQPNKVSLINNKYGKDFQPHLLEQYKIFVDTSEKITEKRLNSNKFYLALNSFVFGLASYLTIDKNLITIVLACIGILISFVWSECISSYKILNSAKFKVILEMEAHLPSTPFKKEDEHLKGYYRLTKLEKFVPYIFIGLYIILIVLSLLLFLKIITF